MSTSAVRSDVMRLQDACEHKHPLARYLNVSRCHRQVNVTPPTQVLWAGATRQYAVTGKKWVILGTSILSVYYASVRHLFYGLRKRKKRRSGVWNFTQLSDWPLWLLCFDDFMNRSQELKCACSPRQQPAGHVTQQERHVAATQIATAGLWLLIFHPCIFHFHVRPKHQITNIHACATCKGLYLFYFL